MEAMYEMFSQMQDQVNFPGYCQALEKEDHEKLNFEFEEFIRQFSVKESRKKRGSFSFYKPLNFHPMNDYDEPFDCSSQCDIDCPFFDECNQDPDLGGTGHGDISWSDADPGL
jgi:hypothetical protein